MFNLLSFYPIVQHIKTNISPNMYQVKSDHIMVHCPFCNDAMRPNARSHGHLYVSIDKPVFICHRCNVSGTIISLLLETDFSDHNVLNELKQFIKYKFTKNYFQRVKINKHINTDYIYHKNLEFRKQYPDYYNQFRNYIYNRIGYINDISYFLIHPELLSNELNVSFYNYDNTLVCWRNINPNNQFRYKMNKGQYYFQKLDFDKYSRIVIAEGPFDIINLYLYNHIFKNSLFISLNSSRYVSEIENLIIKHLLIGDYEINIVFDKNVNHEHIIRKHKYINRFNTNISFKYWFPEISKDTGDYPKITEL